MPINTGYERGGGHWAEPAGPRSLAQVLFSADSPPDQLFSARLTVMPGDALLVSAYNLAANRRVFLNQISVGTFALGGAPCCDLGIELDRSLDLHLQRFKLGGQDWALSAARPQMLLALPGRYRFELEDEDMLAETLQVEYFKWALGGTAVTLPLGVL